MAVDDSIDSLGTIATGGIIAREIDRAHAPGHDPASTCANCGAALIGPYCQACGQHGHVHRTASALVHDILHGVFHFEGKFWATLPLLTFRPGDLTRRYAQGERVKFVSPMAIFLFSVFLMFAVVANLPGWNFGGADFLGAGATAKVDTARKALDEAKAKADANVIRRTAQLAKLRADTPPDADALATAERRLVTARTDVAQIAKAQSLMPAFAAPAPDMKPDTWLEEKIQHARENPKLLLYKIKSSGYKFSWALIPLSLPFIWVLFPFRRDVGLYDHAIFATYSLSFMSLLTIALSVLGWIGVSTAILVFAALLIPPFHIYRQLKGAYRLSRIGALWRTAWMLSFILIIVPLFALLLLYLGVAD